MQKYRIIVTWEAVYDIAEIADYIEAQFGIARADRFQEEIKERLDKLETMGGIWKDMPILPWIFYLQVSISAICYFLYYQGIRKSNPCLKGIERGT